MDEKIMTALTNRVPKGEEGEAREKMGDIFYIV